MKNELTRQNSIVTKITSIFGILLRLFCRKKKKNKKTDDESS